MIETRLAPRGPYSLAFSARLASDATRTFRDGIFTAALGNELVRAWQAPDGTITVRAATDAGVERLRWTLALDDDHSEFLRAVRSDPFLGPASRALRGETDDADTAYRRSVELLEGQGRWRDATTTCRSWARMLRQMGREEQALDVLERAAELGMRATPADARVER